MYSQDCSPRLTMLAIVHGYKKTNQELKKHEGIKLLILPFHNHDFYLFSGGSKRRPKRGF